MIDSKHTILKKSNVHTTFKTSDAQKQYPLGSYVPKTWNKDTVCASSDSILFSASSIQDAITQATTAYTGLAFMLVYTSGTPPFYKPGTTINYNAVASKVANSDGTSSTFISYLNDIVNGDYQNLGKSYTAVFCTDDASFTNPKMPGGMFGPGGLESTGARIYPYAKVFLVVLLMIFIYKYITHVNSRGYVGLAVRR